MWVEKLIRPNPGGWGFFLDGNVNEAGYTSVCTPGAVKMFSSLLERWGTIDFEQAAEPAIRTARDGFVVTDSLAVGWKRSNQYWEGMSLRDYINSNPEARRIYLRDDGQPYDTGETLRNPDYAASLAPHSPTRQRRLLPRPADGAHGIRPGRQRQFRHPAGL